MRRITLSITAICALAPLVALVSAAPSSAASRVSKTTASSSQSSTDTYLPLCEKDSPNYCWRDPSDAGSGPVLNSGYGTDAAREWAIQGDPRCGGTVSNSLACPFTPGSGLNSEFNGDQIVVVRNLGSGDCAGSNINEGGLVYIHECDNTPGVGEPSSVFIKQPFSDHFRLVSLVWSDALSGAVYVNGDNVNDDQLYVGPAGTYSRWVQGQG
jgi:hypothetical protein